MTARLAVLVEGLLVRVTCVWLAWTDRRHPRHQCRVRPIEPGPSVLALWEAQVVAEATDIARTEATR